MKVTLCITVYNEEHAIALLLESLLDQSKKANEILIIDADSSDNTLAIIKHFQKKDKRIKCLVERGNVAHGRNTAVEMAKYDIVAFTDAGCIAKATWLERLVKPFRNKNVDMVAGFYDMPARNPLQKVLNIYHGVTPGEFNNLSFIPSARSVAFRKSLWEEVGGFNEKLEKAGEDTEFFYKVVKLGKNIVRVKNARVIWKETLSLGLRNSLSKYYQYAKGDAQAGIWWHPAKQLSTHNIKVLSIFIRYLIALIFLVLSAFNKTYYLLFLTYILIYIIWSFIKVYKKTSNLISGFWGIFVQITSDIVVMFGFVAGMINK